MQLKLWIDGEKNTTCIIELNRTAIWRSNIAHRNVWKCLKKTCSHKVTECKYPIKNYYAKKGERERESVNVCVCVCVCVRERERGRGRKKRRVSSVGVCLKYEWVYLFVFVGVWLSVRECRCCYVIQQENFNDVLQRQLPQKTLLSMIEWGR